MKATIKLFKAVLIEKSVFKKTLKTYELFLEKTIKKGFIFSPEVVYNYSEEELVKLIKIVENEFSLTGKQMNSSFHKSWNKVKTANIEQLVIEQIAHYITTYGFESLGIYNKNTVYVPNEKLKISELKENINLIVINGYTKEELKEKLINILSSGIALKDETRDDIIEVCGIVDLNELDISKIKNKEVKIKLYVMIDVLPSNPVEFLRYIIYLKTEKTLLIKNSMMFNIIKESEVKIVSLVKNYSKKYGLKKLAEIFYRYKSLFLALRSEEKLKPIINRIRRIANKYHKPMIEDYLNSITSKIKNMEILIAKELEKELDKVNIFRKIRLAYALKFRTTDCKSILYKVRNGKGYAKEFEFNNKVLAKKVLNIILESISKNIKKNVKGKKIYIPNIINYILPATEKQFVGNFPCGTYVTVPKDIIFGVHWENVKGETIDLDLSLINCTVGKIGWDVSYRTDKGDILFSGDITDAPKPNGASELFYVRRQTISSYIMFLNYYNYDESIEVPYKIMIGQEQVSNLEKNYMINPNNVVAVTPTVINERQKMLGLLVTTTKECRFYFVESNIGKSITSSDKDYVEHSRKYLFDFYKNAITLNKILENAGARISSESDAREKCDIDLSPEKLEKDTILNLLI